MASSSISSRLAYLRRMAGKGAAVDVGLNRGDIEDGNGNLGIRRLGSELVVRIPESLSYRVDADEGARGQEVLAFQAAGAHGILLRPDAVRVLRQELAGR